MFLCLGEMLRVPSSLRGVRQQEDLRRLPNNIEEARTEGQVRDFQRPADQPRHEELARDHALVVFLARQGGARRLRRRHRLHLGDEELHEDLADSQRIRRGR